jgi:hypothetical protein
MIGSITTVRSNPRRRKPPYPYPPLYDLPSIEPLKNPKNPPENHEKHCKQWNPRRPDPLPQGEKKKKRRTQKPPRRKVPTTPIREQHSATM